MDLALSRGNHSRRLLLLFFIAKRWTVVSWCQWRVVATTGGWHYSQRGLVAVRIAGTCPGVELSMTFVTNIEAAVILCTKHTMD